MGLSESNLSTITKPFPFLSHCKVPCDSPCCVKHMEQITIAFLIPIHTKTLSAKTMKNT